MLPRVMAFGPRFYGKMSITSCFAMTIDDAGSCIARKTDPALDAMVDGLGQRRELPQGGTVCITTMKALQVMRAGHRALAAHR